MKNINSLILLFITLVIISSCKKDDDDNSSVEIIPPFEMRHGGLSNDYGYSVKQTTDDGFIVTGSTRIQGISQEYVYLLKTNKNGVEEWSKTLGDTNTYSCYGKNIQLTSDGGYIIVGNVTISGSGGEVYLIKTDGSGNEQWSKTFGGTENDYGFSVKQTSDGGYIICCSTLSFGNMNGQYDGYLIKTDDSGNEQWSKTFGGSGNEEFISVIQTLDGGYILCGNYDDDVYLVKTNGNGIEQWSKTFGGNGGNDWGNSVQQTSDGGYIISGFTVSFGNGSSDVYLIKTDGSGNEQWTKTFGGTSEDEGYSVKQTTDGGYVIIGNTKSFVQYPNSIGYDIYLIKTDGSGNEQWFKSIGGTGYDGGYSIEQTTDGGYVITGYSETNTNGGDDVYLIKTDENGDVNP